MGLDVIGDLTEVNVTSPTCFRKSASKAALMSRRCSSTHWNGSIETAAAILLTALALAACGKPEAPYTQESYVFGTGANGHLGHSANQGQTSGCRSVKRSGPAARQLHAWKPAS